jgi:serine phosphatase RsbU (regulator of sigma subunit)/HAMP domain-containing protein
MDQQQIIKVSFSVGTKLLLSIVLLLVLVIFFLNISTLLIVTDDKRAYVYSSQSKETLLAGRQFEDLVRHSTDTLRISLATVDLSKPVSPTLTSSPPIPVATPGQVTPPVPVVPVVTSTQNKALDAVVSNQTDLLMTAIYLWISPTEKLTLVGQSGQELSYQLTTEMMKKAQASLITDSVAYINLSQEGKPPMLGILFADTRMKDNPMGMPVALGVAPLTEFAKLMHNMDLTVATVAGDILFDNDAQKMFGTPFGNQNVSSDPLFMKAKASASSRFAQGSAEFEDRGVKYLGSYDSPGLGITVLDRTEWAKAIRSVYVLGEKFVKIGLIAIGAAVIFAIFFSKSLTAPIQRLYSATKQIAEGNFNLDLKAKGRDEIAALTSSFSVMSKKIVELIKDSVEKANLENELAVASAVQQTLMPPVQFRNEQILIESHCQSASQCGGDWWGFFQVKNKLAVMIADATGHGVPSALITASARSCFSVLQKLAEEDPTFSFSPNMMLSYANRVVHEASAAKIMMTFFVGVIDFDTGKMSYASAGHNPPWVFKKDEKGAFTLNSLAANGTRLGEAMDAAPFEEKSIQVAPGDILFMYTDGLTEGKNHSGDMYGKKKVRKRVEASLARGPKAVVSDLMKEFLAHNGDKPLDDDVTLAVATILKIGSGLRPAGTQA